MNALLASSFSQSWVLLSRKISFIQASSLKGGVLCSGCACSIFRRLVEVKDEGK
jgi:hypothetical protein